MTVCQIANLAKRLEKTRLFAFMKNVIEFRILPILTIGGLIKHIRAVNAICSPTVNCYRRHEQWAPSFGNWNIDDRQATFRIKNFRPRVRCFNLNFTVN